MDALARAMQQIEAMHQAERAWKDRLSADRRYQFLIGAAEASRLDVGECRGIEAFAKIMEHKSGPNGWHRVRASTLAHIRKAYLFNGHRCLAEYRDRLNYWRREEQHARAVETIGRNLVAVDATLAAA